MKKSFVFIFALLLVLMSVKLDSFAYEVTGEPYTFYIICTLNSGTDNAYDMAYRFTVEKLYDDVVGSPRIAFYGEYLPESTYLIHVGSNCRIRGNYTTFNLSTGQTNGPFDFICQNRNNGFDTPVYFSASISILGSSQNPFVRADIPCYTSLSNAYGFLSTGTYTDALNSSDLGFSSSTASSSIPTPVVNWVLNSDGTLSRTLQFTNAQLPQNPNIRMGLQLIVHWASVDNISLSYSSQSAGLLSTGYQVFYDNALSQDGVDLGYPLPNSPSEMNPCPSQINFLTDTNSVALFNSFLTSHPVSERTITYSPDSISSFANSFRSHLGNIDFEYNVPYVSARYYYTTPDGTGLVYGGWTNTYPKLPSQGAVLSINKQNGKIIVPINDGTVNEGLDTDGNVIFDNGVNIDVPENVDFSKVNLSLQSIMSVLGEYPSFLAFLFPYLPEWIPQLLGISLGILFVVGLFRIILK